VRKTTITALSVALILTAGVSSAFAAKATRATKSVAGVRATINQWAAYVLADNSKAACLMLTPDGQKAWAKDNDANNCLQANGKDYQLFHAYPQDAKAIKNYGNTAPVTLKGDVASLPKLSGSGTRELIYKQGLWYINS
jgi:hypothetical protein